MFSSCFERIPMPNVCFPNGLNVYQCQTFVFPNDLESIWRVSNMSCRVEVWTECQIYVKLVCFPRVVKVSQNGGIEYGDWTTTSFHYRPHPLYHDIISFVHAHVRGCRLHALQREHPRWSSIKHTESYMNSVGSSGQPLRNNTFRCSALYIRNAKVLGNVAWSIFCPNMFTMLPSICSNTQKFQTVPFI